MQKGFLVIIALLIVGFPAARALFIPGGFTSHDLTHHVVRAVSMDRLISQGQFPPRWSGELNNGYGYPVFLFNYPLPALLGEVFHKLGLNFVDSVKAVLLVSLLGSALGMYLFLNELLKDKMAAFLGSIFYLYAPVRFLTVYVSAAVGSALGLAFVPFIFWAILKRRVVVGGLAVAGLVLSHNVTALMFAPVILAFSLVRRGPFGLSPQGRRPARLAPIKSGLAGMFLLGLGLSAWFWLPALVEKQYLRYEAVMGRFYAGHFPTLWQLVRSPWGYGLSHPGVEQDALSFQIGLVHIAVMVILAAAVVFKKVREVRVIGGMSVLFFALSVFLMLEISLPLWDNLPLLSYVQFPARFLAVAVFSASIAASLLVKYLPWQKGVFTILLVLVLYANRNHLNINQVFDPGQEYYLSLKTTSSAWGEHLPKWGRVMEKLSLGKLECLGEPAKGECQVSTVRYQKDTSSLVEASVQATEAAKFRFNQFYFPGWTIEVDGSPVRFDYLTSGESYGLPVFDLPAGAHQIKAEFRSTIIRKVADSISVMSLIGMVLWLCANSFPRVRLQQKSSSQVRP